MTRISRERWAAATVRPRRGQPRVICLGLGFIENLGRDNFRPHDRNLATLLLPAYRAQPDTGVAMLHAVVIVAVVIVGAVGLGRFIFRLGKTLLPLVRVDRPCGSAVSLAPFSGQSRQAP